MSAAAVVAVAVAIFLYIEAAIGTGYYMFLVTKRTDTDNEQHNSWRILPDHIRTSDRRTRSGKEEIK